MREQRILELTCMNQGFRTRLTALVFVKYARTKVEGLEFLEVGVAWIQLTCTSLRPEHGNLSLSHPLLGEALEVQRYSLPLKWAPTSNTSV